MSTNQSVIEFGQINDMLDNDPAYVEEFCEAALQSFGTFKRDFKIHMLNRDLENLRKVGHRIKPVAQMLGVDQLVDEYKKAKKLLQENAGMEEIETLVTRIDQLCAQILDEFEQKLSS